MSPLKLVLIVIIVILLVGTLPTWGYSSNFGYGPSGMISVILVILVVLLLRGKL